MSQVQILPRIEVWRGVEGRIIMDWVSDCVPQALRDISVIKISEERKKNKSPNLFDFQSAQHMWILCLIIWNIKVVFGKQIREN